MIAFDANGLAPCVVQHARTGEVLMLGYMNADSLERTLRSGRAWFWSRSRQELWEKGATSGNYLEVERVLTDCDADTLLLQVVPTGPVCHTLERHCFFNQVSGDGSVERRPSLQPEGPGALEALFEVIRRRQAERPEGSYTVKLLDEGVDRIGKKIGEEAVEVVIAAKNPNDAQLAWELADLWYHCLVLLAARGLDPSLIWKELASRRR